MSFPPVGTCPLTRSYSPVAIRCQVHYSDVREMPCVLRLAPGVINQGNYATWAHLVMSRHISIYHNWGGVGATGNYYTGVKDAAMHRKTPNTKLYPPPNISSTTTEKIRVELRWGYHFVILLKERWTPEETKFCLGERRGQETNFEMHFSLHTFFADIGSLQTHWDDLLWVSLFLPNDWPPYMSRIYG